MATNNLKKIILITGGSRGIGAEIVKKFVQLNYEVYATATTEKSANSITKTISDMDGKGKGIVADSVGTTVETRKINQNRKIWTRQRDIRKRNQQLRTKKRQTV